MTKFIKFGNNLRGFVCGTFFDHYGAECSIQESSLATESAIWLGLDHGTHVKNELGQEQCLARMHLTRKQVKKLIKVLQYFVDHRYLPESTD